MFIPSHRSCLVQRRFHCLEIDHPDRTSPQECGDLDPYNTKKKKKENEAGFGLRRIRNAHSQSINKISLPLGEQRNSFQ